MQDSLFSDLNGALRDAIRKPDTLAYFLRSHFGRRLNEMVSLEKDYIAVVAAVVDTAEAEGWTDDLVKAALQEIPGNVKLRTVAQRFGLIPTVMVTAEQEAVIVRSNPFLDMSIWRSKLSAIEQRVCRVKTTETYGTGFLVGPGLLMTSYHVLKPLIEQRIAVDDVRCIFDHKKVANETILSGVSVRLAQDWHVDASPPSLADSLPDSAGALPQTDELDYVIVRTREQPGNEEISGKGHPNARRRGWIDLTRPAPRWRGDDALIIPQYPLLTSPSGKIFPQPLMMTLDTRSIMAGNKNETRLMYRTNSTPGTSGAPCFTINWELIALHRGGNEFRNDGIPLAAIQKLLQARHIDTDLVPFD